MNNLGVSAGPRRHEKTLGELKQHLAFDAIPTNKWGANSAWQRISGLTLNLIRSSGCTPTLLRAPMAGSAPIGWSTSRFAGSGSNCSTSRVAREYRSTRMAADTGSENGVPCNARVSTHRADLLG